MKSILAITLFSLSILMGRHFPNALPPGEDWELVVKRGKLKVYKRASEDSKFKEVKLTTTLPADLDRVMIALDDVSNYTDWVFKCKEARLLTTLSDSEFVYYTLSGFPAPLWDRDAVLLSRQWYDAKTKTMRTSSTIAHDYVDKVELLRKVVRIPELKSEWILRETEDCTTNVVYQAMVDPGGTLPAWAVNLGLSKGPIKTMGALEEILLQ